MDVRAREARVRPRGLRWLDGAAARGSRAAEGGGAAAARGGPPRRGGGAAARRDGAPRPPRALLRRLPRRHQGARAPRARGDGAGARRSRADADPVLLPARAAHCEPAVPSRDQARAGPHMVIPPPLLVIVGPTGVGKTAVTVRLARRLSIEAVNADSRQVYRGMDIGTGKPTADERAALRHWLIDVVDPHERYHAARFRREALAAIAEIGARGALPVVVGGTGLYVRGLLKGLHAAPPADLALRRELDEYAVGRGLAALHARLAALDPAAACALHPNDRIRIVRALEVRLLAGAAAGDAARATADWAREVTGWRLVMIGLRRERGALNRSLADRARAMADRGMMDEVKTLLAKGYDTALPAMGGIGYRQFAAAIQGRLSPDEALRLMIRDTCRYAKRQMTWFSREPEIRWIDVDRAGGIEGVASHIADVVAQEGLIE